MSIDLSSLLPGARVAVPTGTAEVQTGADPLQPTGPDGWSPEHITAVRSRNEGGFLGSAVQFALGGVDERPGQRLSVAQVDALAPFYATQFGLDEGFVRRELAKVYIYTGGPTVPGNAMTIGHHIFVADEAALKHILSPSGKGWLSHELSHTMQFLAYDGGSPHRFLASYFTSMVLGNDPEQPGTGEGPAVWGAFFTGLRGTGRTEAQLGDGSASLRDKLVSTALPAALIGLPVSFAAGGAIGAMRATTGVRLLGTGRPMLAGLGVVGLPALAGAGAALAQEQVGTGGSTAVGAALGGTIAGLTLWRGGAFGVGAGHAVTGIGSKVGRGVAIGLAAGATLLGAGVGALATNASANTLGGGARAAELMSDMRERSGDAREQDELSLGDALHDTNWIEMDAELISRRFVRGEWERPADGAPVPGRTPTEPAGLERINADTADRLDWGLGLPLLLGLPAALGVGAGVLATRTGVTLLRSTLQEGQTLRAATKAALQVLGSQSRGVGNSLGIGAALMTAPLVVGGFTGPVAYDATQSETTAKLVGGGVAAATTGTLLGLLCAGKGSGLLGVSWRVAAGMGLAGVLGLAAGGVATDALHPTQRVYDVSSGTSANPAK